MFTASPRRTATTTIATCAIAAIAAAGASSAVAAPASAKARTDARVVRVTDGEHVVLRTRAGVNRYKLLGVDAPALTDCFGRTSRAKLRKLLPAGTRVKVIARRAGSRSVVVLLPGGAGVNRLMVQTGAAEAALDDGSSLARLLHSAESRAQDAGRGLWGACTDGTDDQQDVAPQPAAPAQPARPAPAPAPNPAPAAPATGTRLNQAQFQAFVEKSTFTRASSSSNFGGSSNQNAFTFCPGGEYGFTSQSFNNGFATSAAEGGRWKLVTLTRDAAQQADVGTLELITETSDDPNFDPTTAESTRTFKVVITSFDDGRVHLGDQAAQKTTAANCTA
jgi:endonuclease YncB( thermonuclease family)